jgi:hypothetical protein
MSFHKGIFQHTFFKPISKKLITKTIFNQDIILIFFSAIFPRHILKFQVIIEIQHKIDFKSKSIKIFHKKTCCI